MLRVCRFQIAALLIGTVSILAGLCSAQQPPVDQRESGPFSPMEAVKRFKLPDDLRIELVACEPDVVDPIDIRFDEHGRLWVVEMRDYPLGPKDGGPPMSRIVTLTDADGDGRYTDPVVFADELLFITGVQPWKDGAIVTISGRVLFLRDTDNDRKADQRIDLFEGFSEKNSQLRANHPRFALDNHFYIASGLQGGKIRRPAGYQKASPDDASGEKEVDILRHDFRFDPNSSDFEAISGDGQFGLSFDDFGNRFVCSNRIPVDHIVIEERYLNQAKGVALPGVVEKVAAFAENSRIFPISKTWTTSNLHEGQFTAACGVNFYRGDALPNYKGCVFTCDPTGNLVHAERVESSGATFKSKPLFEGREFLATTDEWFRPVVVENGPDGNLYVVDMYRAVIEHPEWVPPELKNRPDERWGDDRGRIWRIRSKAKEDRAVALIPAELEKSKLVALLNSPNAWHRETAQRLIVQSQDKGYLELIEKLPGDLSPEGLTHVLATLEGLKALRGEHFKAAFRLASQWSNDDRISRSRWVGAMRNIMIFSEGVVPQWRSNPKTVVDLRASIWKELAKHQELLGQKLLSWGNDAGTGWPGDTSVLAEVADDPWTQRIALVSAARSERPQWLVELLASKTANPPLALIEDMAIVLGSRTDWSALANADRAKISEYLAILKHLAKADAPKNAAARALFAGLCTGLSRRDGNVTGGLALLAKIEPSFNAEPWMNQLVAAAGEKDDSSFDLAKAIELLTLFPDKAELLFKIAREHKELPARQAALRGLARHGTLEQWRELADSLKTQTPAMTKTIYDGLLMRGDRIDMLLTKVESQEIPSGFVEPSTIQRLMTSGDQGIRDRASKLWAPPSGPERDALVAKYKAALSADPQPARGKAVFQKNCAQCHKIDTLGVNVGPDISDLRTKSHEQVLLDILEPNRAIDANFVGYSCATTDGRTLTGILTSETSSAITIKQQQGVIVTLAREEVEEIIPTGKSLMPEGIERVISPSEMADVVYFVKEWRYLDGRIPKP